VGGSGARQSGDGGSSDQVHLRNYVSVWGA
jgi:hypothetical protein